MASQQPQAPAHPPKGKARRAYRAYTEHSRAVRATGQRIAQQTPGTDTFGTAFKMLTVAGLIGLGIFHPEAVSGVLTKATATIRTVITGGK